MSDESFMLYLPDELPELTEEEEKASDDEFMRRLLEICSKPLRHGADDHE